MLSPRLIRGLTVAGVGVAAIGGVLYVGGWLVTLALRAPDGAALRNGDQAALCKPASVRVRSGAGGSASDASVSMSVEPITAATAAAAADTLAAGSLDDPMMLACAAEVRVWMDGWRLARRKSGGDVVSSCATGGGKCCAHATALTWRVDGWR